MEGRLREEVEVGGQGLVQLVIVRELRVCVRERGERGEGMRESESESERGGGERREGEVLVCGVKYAPVIKSLRKCAQPTPAVKGHTTKFTNRSNLHTTKDNTPVVQARNRS